MTEPEFSLKLIREIKSRPCLYNYNLTEYNQKDIADKAWEEVAKETGTEVCLCKEEWRSIRSVFARHLKQGITNGYTTYHLFDDLKFLIPFMKKTETSIDETEVYNDILIVYSAPQAEEEESDDSETTQMDPTQISDATQFDTVEIDVNDDEIFLSTNNKDFDHSRAHKVSLHRPRYTEQIKKNKGQPIKINKSNAELCSNRKKQEEDAKREFLMSLIPDLNSMDNQQTRCFKRRVLEIVNGILDGVGTTT